MLRLLLSAGAIVALMLNAAAAGARPNVLLICVDDLKPLLGCYGDRGVHSPNIDRLAKRGALFERAYCNQAVCAPSRNALMTGVRPTRSGIYDLGTNFRAAHRDAVTVSQYFMRHGYRAEALGKIFHVGHGNHEDPASWSVPHWKENSIAYVLPESRAKIGLTREEALFSNQPGGNLPRGAAHEAADVPDNAYPDGRIAEEAMRRLQSAHTKPGEPFFLAVGFLKPHLPFCAPKKYWDLYDRAAFQIPARRQAPDGAPKFAPSNWGELRNYTGIPAIGPVSDDEARMLIHGYHATVSYVDAQLGRVLDELDRLNLTTNTVIVLWGDHGWHLGDHGWWSKHSNYEEATRIPLIIAAPGTTKPGTRVASSFAETVDVFPTLAELAGLPVPQVPQGLDGRSLVPALRRPTRAFATHAMHTFPRGDRVGRAVRTERHRLVEWKVPGASNETAIIELYDYEADPGETRNLASEQPRVVARLRRLIEKVPEAKPQLRRESQPARKAQAGSSDRSSPSEHWSFQPVKRSLLPPTTQRQWPRNDIDRFILARLEKEGLKPSPETDRVNWLRRVYFDLIGLPPTPEQVDAFVKDRRRDAYERVVDELLQSPRYGERWAQHWLDVVRYADTHGFEVNTERPHAWPYRDYVIRAFNKDTRYDQFIREQIVGDSLGEDAATGFLITASVLLPGQIGADDVSKRLARQDAIDEIVVNIGQTFLGLSVGCARCHDHKFDPISARDYFAMQAFVAGVEYEDREMRSPEADAKRESAVQLGRRLAVVEHLLSGFTPLARSGMERPAVNARMNTDRFAAVKAKRVRFTIRGTNNLEPCVDEIEVFDTNGVNIALASKGTIATSSGNNVAPDRHELRFVNDGEYGNSRSWMSSEHGGGWVALEFAEERVIDRVVWGRDRKGEFADRLATNYVIEVADTSGAWSVVADSSDRAIKSNGDKAGQIALAGLNSDEAREATRLMDEKKSIEGKIRASEESRLAFAGRFRAPDKIHLLHRGDPEQPKDEVAPAVLSALGSKRLARETSEQERRRTLADWIVSPENPLTSRVMVNRIWQGHFGTGLVDTPSDFGRNGGKPSHPELLDWLASEFVRGGWSVKQMHRLIVLSATYRQRSVISEPVISRSVRKSAVAVPEKIDSLNTDSLFTTSSTEQQRDSDVRLLWRFPSRRLESEPIRDAMLGVSGKLNLKMYGRGFDLFNQRGGLSGFKPVESFGGDGLRRMIYAHKVRREREAVFGAFDCPDAGQSTARRRESTTPIQALNLFNSRFTIDQAEAFSARVKKEVGDDVTRQIQRAYQLSLSRKATAAELSEARPVVARHGLAVLCRALFNSNEFLFVP